MRYKFKEGVSIFILEFTSAQNDGKTLASVPA
jgi:hypothetical protein